MQTITEAIRNILQIPNKSPLHLFEISLTNTTLRYVAAKKPLVWPQGGNVYFSKGAEIRGYAKDINQNGTGIILVTFADADGAVRGNHQNDDFIGKQLTARRIFWPATTAADDAEILFQGRIEQVEMQPNAFAIRVATTGTLRRKFPGHTFTARCRWKPGGTECNQDGNLANSTAPHRKEGTATVLSGTTIDDTSRTEINDTWKWGSITVTDGNAVYERQVLGSTNAGVLTLDMPIPSAVDSSVTYVLARGCDGTVSACMGEQAYGATANNLQNYGGFPQLEEERT